MAPQSAPTRSPPAPSASYNRAFEIRFDPARDILHMRPAGFWTLDTFDAYVRLLGIEAGD